MKIKFKKRQVVFPLLVAGLVWVGWGMWDIKSSRLEYEEEILKPVEDLDEFLVDIYGEMMLGQMFIVGIDEQILTEEEKELLQQSKVGGVILMSKNIDNEEQLYNLTSEISKTATVSGMMPWVSVDQEGGVVSRIPFIEDTAQNRITDSFDALGVSIKRSQQLKDLGINVNYAPVIEGRGEKGSFAYRQGRSFSDDDFLIAETVIDGCNEVGIICVAKHFPGGLSRVEKDPHVNLPSLELGKDEIKQDLMRFSNIFDSGARAVMVTHIYYPEIDGDDISSSSRIFIREILREEMGFSGLVFIDDVAMGAIRDMYEIEDFVVASIRAGADQLIVSNRRVYNDFWEEVVKRVGEDVELKKMVVESYLRIRETKSEL